MPRNGCYARLHAPAQPWPHTYGIGGMEHVSTTAEIVPQLRIVA